MTVTKEYCDRCGEEVKSEPLSYKLFPIRHYSQKNYIRFSKRLNYTEQTYMVCEKCLRDFWKWWGVKE